jgi:hypothetical protein
MHFFQAPVQKYIQRKTAVLQHNFFLQITHMQNIVYLASLYDGHIHYTGIRRPSCSRGGIKNKCQEIFSLDLWHDNAFFFF